MRTKPTNPLESDYADLLSYMTKKVGMQDAADLVHDAYLRLLTREEPEPLQSPRAFLFRIAANLGVDGWRRSERWAKITGDEVDLDVVPCPDPGPGAALEGQLKFEAFLAILDELPEAQRTAFILAKIEGCSHQDIAERLGVSTKSVHRYLAAAMDYCLERLEF